jgi:signal transduction histidine kinase
MASSRLHGLLVVASVLVPATLFGAVALKDRRDTLREGEASAARTAAVLREHASKVFETGQLVLDRVDGRIRAQSWAEIAAPDTSAFLARIKAPLEQVVSIWITDANGRVQAGSQPWDRSVSLSGRDFFNVHTERDVGTFIGTAFRGLATGISSFAISQRRTAPDGRFDGTIHISLSPEYFARFFADASPELAHTASLIRADGHILARQPGELSGRPLGPQSPLMRRIAEQPEGGTFTGVSTLDGVVRIFAYRRVGPYPVYVGFGIERAALLQRWQSDLLLSGGAAAAASLLLVLLSFLAMRGMQAEEAATARLREAMEALRHETDQREQAESRVRQAQKMEAVGQLTSGIAHDFNNLITAVLGSLEMLRKRLPPGDERGLRLLDNAMLGAERGAALTQRLLAFGRGQALKPEAVDLAGLVGGMVELLGGSLGAGVRLDIAVPEGLPAVRADANQLELALLNLAVNARDAMPCGGTLSITARRERSGARQAAELPPGDYVVLSVADDGEGMDEATLARCVEPFFTTKGVGKGTGLGLSMVHGFAAQSGGRLVLSSRMGEGTTAELWLPEADSQAMATLSVTATPPAPAGDRLAILVVDDDRLVAESTGALLEEMGHQPRLVASAREALEALRAGAQVDLVLTDHAMPGMTGTELAAEVARGWPSLPVLLMSGYAEAAGGGLPVLPKPFEQQALARALAACLRPATTSG